MSTSALIARMIAAGMPPDLIGDIAAELGKADAERAILAQRRQNERDRKARSREVTGQHVTARDGADNLSPEVSPQVFPKDIISNPNPNPLPTPNPTARPKANLPFPKPEGVEDQHWRDFLANRARKRLPNTATAHAKLMRDLTKFADDEWPPGRILQHAAEHGWAGIYDPRNSEHRNGHTTQLDKPKSDRWAGYRTGLEEPDQQPGPPLSEAGEPIH